MINRRPRLSKAAAFVRLPSVTGQQECTAIDGRVVQISRRYRLGDADAARHLGLLRRVGQGFVRCHQWCQHLPSADSARSQSWVSVVRGLATAPSERISLSRSHQSSELSACGATRRQIAFKANSRHTSSVRCLILVAFILRSPPTHLRSGVS